jgi:cholesterol transport system auxiliary component
VEPFRGLAPYDTTRIIYSTDRFTRNRYVYHQWIAEPAEMVTQLLSRDIRNANIFRAVMTTNDPMATHLIRGTVEGFYENDSREKWDAILSVTVTLIKKDEVDIAKKICFQKNYVASQACAENNPEGLAAAMSMAMAKVSERIIIDIRTAVSCL